MRLSETLYLNHLTENTMTRLKSILLGKDPSIRYFCIGTPENPMGVRLSTAENKERCREFEQEMKAFHIPFIKIEGSYGNKENSYILPNLRAEVAEEIFGFDGYDQESFIFGESNAGGVDFYYYQKNKGDSPYQLLDAERGITMMNDAEDFFSSKKAWKFKIDFSIFRESRGTKRMAKTLSEHISYKYPFSGDRYIDYVLSYWLDWWNKENNNEFDPTNEQLDEMFLDFGFDKLAEIIFREFPFTAEITGQDFNAEYCWEEFLRTKEGRKAEEWLEEATDPANVVIDSAYLLEDLDDDLIAESTYANQMDDLDEFFKNHPEGKKMSQKDKGVLATAISDGEVGEFKNGYAFTPSEFVDIEITDHDGENDFNSLTKMYKESTKWAVKSGKLLYRVDMNYNDIDVDVIFSINLDSLAYYANKK